MPSRPAHPCAASGCPELTQSRYCPAHARQEAQRYERYQRDPATAGRYDADWRKLRAAYVAAHPLCEDCAERGLVVPAQEVHHIRPLSVGGTHSWDNLRALCTSCHSRITATEGGRWGR